MGTDLLELREVAFNYPSGTRVLGGLSFSVARGEVVAVVGPSGCGKTTLLGLLAGHLEMSEGVIERRGTLRTLFQQDSLLPWLTVRENVGLDLRRLSQQERARKVDALLELVRFPGSGDLYPRELSGGMRQRAELARVFAGEVAGLLLDEPFSALDYPSRLEMRAELERLLLERQCSVVLVTHDVEEAVLLADRVIVLSRCPSRVALELPVEAPRTRTLATPGVTALLDRIHRELGLAPVATPSRAPAASAGAAGSSQSNSGETPLRVVSGRYE